MLSPPSPPSDGYNPSFAASIPSPMPHSPNASHRHPWLAPQPFPLPASVSTRASSPYPDPVLVSSAVEGLYTAFHIEPEPPVQLRLAQYVPLAPYETVAEKWLGLLLEEKCQVRPSSHGVPLLPSGVPLLPSVGPAAMGYPSYPVEYPYYPV